jgi:hypothetical protein
MSACVNEKNICKNPTGRIAVSETLEIKHEKITQKGDGYMKKIFASILIPVAVTTLSQIAVHVVDAVFSNMNKENELVPLCVEGEQ